MNQRGSMRIIIHLSDVKELIQENPEIFYGLKSHIVKECLQKLPKNIHVLNGFADHALHLKRNGGREHYGINCIQEILRWESYFQEEDDAYKINNNHGPVYGRIITALIPELRGMFRIKGNEENLEVEEV